MKNKRNCVCTIVIILTIVAIFSLVITLITYNKKAKILDAFKSTFSSINAVDFEDNSNSYIFNFIDLNSEEELAFLNNILTYVSYDFYDVKVVNGGLEYKVEVTAPAIGAIMSKEYPIMFTYDNVQHYSRQTQSISPEEYKTQVLNNVTNLLKTNDLYTKNTLIVSCVNTTDGYSFQGCENLENYILGKIYNYQNIDVMFNNLDELICPTNADEKTIEQDVDNIFGPVSFSD